MSSCPFDEIPEWVPDLCFCHGVRGGQCPADLGPWGAWRACGGQFARQWADAICDLGVDPGIAAEIMFGSNRYYLMAAGWSP